MPLMPAYAARALRRARLRTRMRIVARGLLFEALLPAPSLDADQRRQARPTGRFLHRLQLPTHPHPALFDPAMVFFSLFEGRRLGQPERKVPRTWSASVR